MFFANATLDGKKPVSEATASTMLDRQGTQDVFGGAYKRLAGTVGANRFDNSRPSGTEPTIDASNRRGGRGAVVPGSTGIATRRM